MTDPQLDVIRAALSAHPRPADVAERGARVDGLGGRVWFRSSSAAAGAFVCAFAA
jgi:hypothetical protein